MYATFLIASASNAPGVSIVQDDETTITFQDSNGSAPLVCEKQPLLNARVSISSNFDFFDRNKLRFLTINGVPYGCA